MDYYKSVPGKVNLMFLFFLFVVFNGCKKEASVSEIQETPSDTVKQSSYNIDASLCDPNADASAKALYNWMKKQFGVKIISGQTSGQTEGDYIKKITGKTPLMRTWDMQPYSPRYPYLWDNSCGCQTFGPYLDATHIDDAIAWYNSNGKKPIINFQWHWHSPLGGAAGTNTFYTDQTSFDISRAVIPNTAEYTATLRDIDAIAVQLKKLQDAGVPVLWRPLHEAGGTWFWWSAKGAGAYKALWNLMYDRLTNYHQLHNLIWIWNGDNALWYVGNDKCDIVGIDYYGTNFTYSIAMEEFEKVYKITKGTKIIALTENGAIPDIDKAFKDGAPWSFFMTWYDHLTNANSDDHISEVFNNSKVITIENYQ